MKMVSPASIWSLVNTIIGRYPLLMNEVKYHFPSSVSEMVCDNIKYITFRDSYGDADGAFYYQQRWNSQDMETTPLVRELLPEASDEDLKKKLFTLFGLEDFMDKHIVLLSSGELRKLQIVKALLQKPPQRPPQKPPKTITRKRTKNDQT